MTTTTRRFTVIEGNHRGTSDDVAGRWYVVDREGDAIDKRGRGYPTRHEAEAAAARAEADTADTMTTRTGKFTFRLVRSGGMQHNGFTHEADRPYFGVPTVEVYDARQDPEKFGQWGQFVATYYVTTIAETRYGTALNLYGGVPAWTMTPGETDELRSFCERALA